MAKSKSQWDFGELFPAEQMRRVLTVGEITTKVRRLLEEGVGKVWVTGEVTNLRAQSSGHIYFTLKDAVAQLGCVLFRGEAIESRALVKDGQKIVLQGELTVFEPRGQYQLIVHAVELQGVGALQLAFERLKQKLQAEGLFAVERKRTLPRYPQCLGLVTSATGAAIRDVLHVIQRRQPALQIILAPCRVQGEGAAAEIAAAIRLLNAWRVAPSSNLSGWKLDLILVTRGGGSLEDLWAFNEETVARAIFESALPIVSAIGHEIDFTISDFVADLRASTPSAAAELITEAPFACRHFIAEADGRLRLLARRRFAQERDNLGQFSARLARVHPRRLLQEKFQSLDELQLALVRCLRQGWRDRRAAWLSLQQRLLHARPSTLLLQRRQVLRELARRLFTVARQRLKDRVDRMATLAASLLLLSPEKVLARGYSITTDAATGRVVRAASEVAAGRKLKTKLAAGEVRSVVEE